ncbi:putative mitochondrial glycoprotein [Helianthus debilis subsp. tardiflorus]
MWRTAMARATGAIRLQLPEITTTPFHRYYSSSITSPSAVVNSMILRSLKEHYTEVSKMAPPPKVSPPEPFTVVKGALDSGGPVLTRVYGDEEIRLSVMRMINILPEVGPSEIDGDDEINQLFLHVDVSKPNKDYVLHFLCGLYPDAVGIHSVSLRHKLETSGLLEVPSKYNGPSFEALDDRMRDAFHGYIEERGINDGLFPFLQAWLYVKDHRGLMHWFKSVGTCVKKAN